MDTPIKPTQTTQAPSPAPAAAPVTAAPSQQEIVDLLTRVAKMEAAQAAQATLTPLPPPSIEIDWSRVTEKSVADLNFPIPVIEHELPDYMSAHLNDDNYVAKWVHKLASHVGSLKAMGYELVKESDWDSNYPKVLTFNSEGNLTYEDVVLMKVHKSRYFGKLRREFLKSTQIRGVAGYAKVKGQVNQLISNTPHLESALARGAMSFYGEQADSAVEVQL